MERNASGLVIGVALDIPPLSAAHLYTLKIYQANSTFFLGKQVDLPISLTELELVEAHVASVAAKLSIPLKPAEFFLLVNGN